VLERLRSDPGKVCGESLRYRPDGWIVLAEMPDDSTWWVIWRQPMADMVDVLWIGRSLVWTRWPTPRRPSSPNGHHIARVQLLQGVSCRNPYLRSGRDKEHQPLDRHITRSLTLRLDLIPLFSNRGYKDQPDVEGIETSASPCFRDLRVAVLYRS
jgi:hypothetical protein